MKYTFAIAMLMNSSAAVRVQQAFAGGMTDDDIFADKQAQIHSQKFNSIAQTGSRWVELPDCSGSLGEDDVPLKEDLSNAIIATCKAYVPGRTQTAAETGESAEETYRKQWKKDYSHWQPQPIYDAVVKSSKPIVDHEHQVTQHQDGFVDPTDGVDGPHGDWYMYGKPTSEQPWKAPNLVQIYQNSEDPSDIQVIQLSSSKNTNWVELPNCRGDSGEISLDADLANASLATCKKKDNKYIGATKDD